MKPKEIVRVSVTCLISNVVTNPCSRLKPTETGGHVIWSSGIAYSISFIVQTAQPC